jgi:hypothetical protein
VLTYAVALPQAFQDGRLRVEGRQVGMDEPLTSGDCMRHFIHRHEPPVMAGDIEVGGQQVARGRGQHERPGRVLAWVACGRAVHAVLHGYPRHAHAVTASPGAGLI